MLRQLRADGYIVCHCCDVNLGHRLAAVICGFIMRLAAFKSSYFKAWNFA
jgi:hypothetical protein